MVGAALGVAELLEAPLLVGEVLGSEGRDGRPPAVGTLTLGVVTVTGAVLGVETVTGGVVTVATGVGTVTLETVTEGIDVLGTVSEGREVLGRVMAPLAPAPASGTARIKPATAAVRRRIFRDMVAATFAGEKTCANWIPSRR